MYKGAVTRTYFIRMTWHLPNEEQIITGYPIDGAMGSSGGGRLRKLSVVCLHNNAIVVRGILVNVLHCGTPEPRLSAIFIVSYGRRPQLIFNTFII